VFSFTLYIFHNVCINVLAVLVYGYVRC